MDTDLDREKDKGEGVRERRFRTRSVEGTLELGERIAEMLQADGRPKQAESYYRESLGMDGDQVDAALGLAGSVRPVTIQRLAAWANALAADGLALTPVSALVQPPPAPPAPR